METKIVYCDNCGEYLGDLVNGVLYKFGKLVNEEHSCSQGYTLQLAKRYEITNRATRQTGQASAFSADEACRKLGWMIGGCYVRELGIG